MAVTNNSDLEKRLWEAADQLRANSRLRSSEYSVPVLGLIFLRYADYKFTEAQKQLGTLTAGSRRTIGKADYQARGVLYLPEGARYSSLLQLPESSNFGLAINTAMELIENNNDELKGVLPKTYTRLENDILISLLKRFSQFEMSGDVFGRIYEYFLGKFAMAEGQRGGEFFTPPSLVRLIVDVIEPFHGRILDPACGSGGMFVWSARFVEERKGNPSTEIMVYGQEKEDLTVKLCRMNLAVHGLSGDIRQANTYYENIHDCVGRFDFVMTNPPFNVNGVDKERIKDDPRYPFGTPTVDNANYLWIQEFASALNENGRAGFVMANSAADARGSELEIRKRLIEERAVDVMIAISSNFFYTVTLPCTLWFLDRGKRNTERGNKVLFIDARQIYTQVDRAHREYTDQQIEFIANIARLYRDDGPENLHDSVDMLAERFPDGVYTDVPGLCKVAMISEIESQGWSLNPGRYVGIADRPAEDFDFVEKLEELNEELETLNAEARVLEERIAENIAALLEGQA
ncbi:MAG: SAM-dependent DNA methyltransferase [Armatimonadetes bacterium]|nr:SAM-dependent DNA methyltransferase [Armatimonadota bacterium]